MPGYQIACFPPKIQAPARFETASRPSGSLPYALLLLFLVQLYGNVAVLYPALDVVRPAMTIGALTLLVCVIERLLTSRGFEFLWPESHLLVAFAGAAALSAPGAFWPGLAVQSTIDFIKIVVIYLVILNSVDTEKRLRGLAWTMVLAGLFPAIGALRFYHAGTHMFEGRLGWVGIFANPNELAYGLAILFPLAATLSTELGFLRRALVWTMLGAYGLVIYLTYSRGGLLGLFAVLGLMALLQKRASVRLVAFGLMVAALVAVALYWSRSEGFSNLSQDSSFGQRITTYITGLKIFADHPLFGAGINCSSAAWPFYAPKNLHYHTWLVVHNTFLQALSETGLVGFLPYIGFLLYTLHRAWKTARAAAQAGQERFANLARALLISYVGFLVCGMSGGFVMTWFPYLLAGMIGASARIQCSAGVSTAKVLLPPKSPWRPGQTPAVQEGARSLP